MIKVDRLVAKPDGQLYIRLTAHMPVGELEIAQLTVDEARSLAQSIMNCIEATKPC